MLEEIFNLGRFQNWSTFLTKYRLGNSLGDFSRPLGVFSQQTHLDPILPSRVTTPAMQKIQRNEYLQ
jgi:hypothetical protein